MYRILALLFVLTACAMPASAELDVKLDGEAVQGGMMLGNTDPSADVFVDGKPIRVSDSGTFVFGFGRDFDGSVELKVINDGAEFKKSIPVAKREYQIQRIDGLPSKYVAPPKEVYDRIKRENAEIARIRALDTDGDWFSKEFIWPARGTISGVFGSQRVLNGEPKRPHFGVDVAAPVGTPVYEAAGGIVALAEPDLYYTGGTIMIDHGHGVTGVYSHLNTVEVKVGQVVAQGDRIGTIGSTGRSTGPHLDWRLNWFQERLDPQRLVGQMPTDDKAAKN